MRGRFCVDLLVSSQKFINFEIALTQVHRNQLYPHQKIFFIYNKMRSTSRRLKSRRRHRSRRSRSKSYPELTPKERAEAVRLLRLHASSLKNATIHRDLLENYRELKRFLGKRAYNELRRRVKEADRPIRKRSKPRRIQMKNGKRVLVR